MIDIYLLLVLFIVSLGSIVAYSILELIKALNPESEVTGKTPGDLGLEYENVEFDSKDGTALKGWFLSSEDSEETVVLIHGYGGTKENFLEEDLSFLLDEGYNVFMFDLRGHGESEDSFTTFGLEEKEDVLAAIKFLKEEKSKRAEKIYAIGYSMGASSLLRAASRTEKIDKIVSDSGFSDFETVIRNKKSALQGHLPFLFSLFPSLCISLAEKIIGIEVEDLNVSREVGEIKNPVFIIHSRGDQILDVDNAFELYNKAKEPKYLWVENSPDHIEIHKNFPEKYKRKISKFLRGDLEENYDVPEES